jgi:putative transposase
MHGNRYQVDPATAGRRVELVFDPFDLTILAVRCDGKDAGTATPHHITRHAHPKARPEERGGGGDIPRATGIDYLSLLGEQHDRQAARPVNYAALITPAADHRTAASAPQEQDEQPAGEQDSRG